ncbi:MAG: peptidylprolyl isomerase [Chloroflexi bacterium]|nr:peptidylprolyl isomerase [Chloroflexota bacterium]
MSKRRRGSPRPRSSSAGTEPTQPSIGDRPTPRGVRPKVSGRRSQPPPHRGGPSPAAIAAIVIGGLAIVALGYVAATSFLAGPSPLPTFGGGGASASPGPTRDPDTADCPTSQPPALPAGETRTVTIETELGDIVIKVDGSLSPIAAGNFVALADCGYYDGVVFHRLMPGFVIQGGDPAGTGSGGPGYTIEDEPITGTYHRGSVAMARTPAPHSQGSQFFIVQADDAARSLAGADPGYALFGEVTAGMDVVDQIAAGPNTGGQEGRALDPVAMTRVTVSNP